MKTFLKVLTAACVLAVAASASTVVINDAGDYNRFPFGYDASQTVNYQAGAQFQTDYSASDFGTSPMLITQIAFATSSERSNATLATYSLTVSLGTLATGGNGPSNTFSANDGSNYEQVFNGTISFVPAENDTFDMLINLSTPYLYNPANGDLLFDVFVNSSTVAGTLEFAGDEGNDYRVYNATAGATTGSVDDNTLYTQITYTNAGTLTPEPATLGMVGLSAGVLLFAWGRKALKRNRA